jgi:hypothetical protein
MHLPFTADQFLGIFAAYNTSVWPMQVILNLLALAAIILAIVRPVHADRAISLILGILWLWTGAVYHIMFFTSINPAAYGFGTLCVIQGVLFLWMVTRRNIQYQATMQWRGVLGSIFLLYGLVIYPILGYALGHVFPASPTFGAPCPTTIFTFGILLWATGMPRFIPVIPALWSLIGFSAALSLGIREDIGLLVAGVIGSVVMFMTRPGTGPATNGAHHAGVA